MPEVIFDSSFLMAVAEKPTTWLQDITQSVGKFEPVVLDCVHAELQRISSGIGKKAKVATVALELSKGFGRRKCGEGEPDDELVSAALGSNAAVATVDASLAETLRGLHVKVVGLMAGRAAVL